MKIYICIGLRMRIIYVCFLRVCVNICMYAHAKTYTNTQYASAVKKLTKC